MLGRAARKVKNVGNCALESLERTDWDTRAAYRGVSLVREDRVANRNRPVIGNPRGPIDVKHVVDVETNDEHREAGKADGGAEHNEGAEQRVGRIGHRYLRSWSS